LDYEGSQAHTPLRFLNSGSLARISSCVNPFIVSSHQIE
jgi:hypothetical protein